MVRRRPVERAGAQLPLAPRALGRVSADDYGVVLCAVSVIDAAPQGWEFIPIASASLENCSVMRLPSLGAIWTKPQAE